MWFENYSFENCEVFYGDGSRETHSCHFELNTDGINFSPRSY